MRSSRLVFVLVLLVLIIETVRLWFRSPPIMAAHFNILGQPDRFVSKAEFFSFEIQTMFIVIGLALVSPLLLLIIPVQFINVPNREYWFLSAQRPIALNRLGTFLDVIFISILLAVHAVFELAVSANLRTPIMFAPQYMLLFIAGYIIFTLLMLFWLINSFRIPAE